MLRNAAINLVLKVGLGITSLGFAIYSLAYPGIILDFYPQFIPNMIGDLATLILGSLVALFMTVWIFSRKHKFACVFVFLILISLAILSNITSLRFVSVAWPLLIISLALTIRYYPRVRIIVPHKDGERMRIVPIEPDEESGDDSEQSNGDKEDEAEDMLLHGGKKDRKPTTTPTKTSSAPINPVPTPEPKPETSPSNLQNDPAHTEDFLNNDKFIRGNKFLSSDLGSEDISGHTYEQPTIKRTYKSRITSLKKSFRKKTTRRRSNSDASDIHDGI